MHIHTERDLRHNRINSHPPCKITIIITIIIVMNVHREKLTDQSNSTWQIIIFSFSLSPTTEYIYVCVYAWVEQMCVRCVFVSANSDSGGVMILGIHLNSRHLHFKFKILPFVFSLVLKFMYICCSSTQQKWVAFDLAQIRTKFSQTHSHTERRTTNHLKQRTHINSLEYTYTWNLYSE